MSNKTKTCTNDSKSQLDCPWATRLSHLTLAVIFSAVTLTLAPATVAHAWVTPADVASMLDRRVTVEKKSGRKLEGILVGKKGRGLRLRLDGDSIVKVPIRRVRSIKLVARVQPTPAVLPPLDHTVVAEQMGGLIRVRKHDGGRQDGRLVGVDESGINVINDLGQTIEVAGVNISEVHQMTKIDIATRPYRNHGLLLLVGGNAIAVAMMVGAAFSADDCFQWGECGAMGGLGAGGAALAGVSTAVGIPLFLKTSSRQIRTRGDQVYSAPVVGLQANWTF